LKDVQPRGEKRASSVFFPRDTTIIAHAALQKRYKFGQKSKKMKNFSKKLKKFFKKSKKIEKKAHRKGKPK
jgi:hypothetical protein